MIPSDLIKYVISKYLHYNELYKLPIKVDVDIESHMKTELNSGILTTYERVYLDGNLIYLKVKDSYNKQTRTYYFIDEGNKQTIHSYLYVDGKFHSYLHSFS